MNINRVRVSRPQPLTVNRSPLTAKKVVLVDCGVKANIIRCLLRRGVEVIRVPWDYDFNQLEFDGLFLANGPGDPERCEVTVRHIRTFLENESKKVATPLASWRGGWGVRLSIPSTALVTMQCRRG